MAIIIAHRIHELRQVDPPLFLQKCLLKQGRKTGERILCTTTLVGLILDQDLVGLGGHSCDMVHEQVELDSFLHGDGAGIQMLEVDTQAMYD